MRQTGEDEASREVGSFVFSAQARPDPLITSREHIESNHIDSLVFNCPFCNKEIKNRVALRSHISKNHREENLRSKGLVL